jgi:hypothetical protein
MITEQDQMNLFAPEKPAALPARKGPAQVYSIAEIARNVLASKGPRACRNCRCTEESPCGLSDGDKCSINQRTGYCSAPHCQAVAARVGSAPIYARAVGR